MDTNSLEIHTALPRYGTHGGRMCRKFGAYEGELVLITEFTPENDIDIPALVERVVEINRSVEDDYMFDYRGTFECYCEDKPEQGMLRSMVLYPEGGLLSGLIFSDIKLGWSFRIQIAIQIARALCHLHNNNIIHNDLHSQALAFDSEWNCKLLDMFYASRVDDIYSPYSLVELKNECAYAAPEMHVEGSCCAASDVYSFGICLFEICSRVLVTSIFKDVEIFRESAADLVLDHLPTSIPDSLRELIRQMLCFDVEYRPSIDDTLDWLESLLSETCLDDEPPIPPLPKLPFPERRNSPAQRGRGSGYAISKADAERLRAMAKIQREGEMDDEDGCLTSGDASPTPPQSESSSSSNIMIGVANEAEVPDLAGYLQLKADNLPFYKSKFFFFKDHNLVWCSDVKLREQAERLHFFDLSLTRIADNSSPLAIHLELDMSLAPEPLPGQSRKKLYRSSRARDRLIIKFSSTDIAHKWKDVLLREILVDRCKMCRVKLVTPFDRESSRIYEGKDFFCSAVCVNYYVATTARGMLLSGKTLKYSNSLRLSKTDIQALDKKVIARRNPKSWKRILKKQGSDLSHGIEKESIEEATPLPQSIEEWLSSIGQDSLLSKFLESGYGCIGHIIIASLYEEDMNEIGIEDKKVRLLLMTQSKILGQIYVKNRKYLLSREE